MNPNVPNVGLAKPEAPATKPSRAPYIDNGNDVCLAEYIGDQPSPSVNIAHATDTHIAQRIVAALNFCEGISTERLKSAPESAQLPNLLRSFQLVVLQRKTLAAAVHRMLQDKTTSMTTRLKILQQATYDVAQLDAMLRQAEAEVVQPAASHSTTPDHMG